MRRCKRDDKNYTVARVIICRNARVMWEGTRLPRDVARLLNTGGSAHIHGRILEVSTRRLPRGDNRDTRNTRRIEPLQRQGRQRARATQQDMGLVVPSRSDTVTIHRDLMQEGRTYGDSFPNNKVEEAGQGRM